MFIWLERLINPMTPHVIVPRRRGRGSFQNVVVITDGKEPEEINRADDQGLPEADLTEEKREEAARRMAGWTNDAER